MKLYTFEVQTPLGPFERVGVQDGSRLVDTNFAVASFLRRQGHEDEYAMANLMAPPVMVKLLKYADNAVSLLKDAIKTIDASTGARGEKIIYDIHNVKLLSPLPRPRRIHDFMEVEEHVRNSLKSVPPEWYNIPICYKGNPDAVVGTDVDVRWPRYTEKLDYELELCAILGKKGRDIPETDAEKYIFGYSIFNDFSARDIQMREMSVGLGPFKGKDFATAIGPCIVTRDSFDPFRAKMVARVNGDVWSEGYIKGMRFNFAQIISYLSDEEFVYPGDVIGSGTVAKGCGLEINRWIKPGDVVELEVEGIGTLRNKVIRGN